MDMANTRFHRRNTIRYSLFAISLFASAARVVRRRSEQNSGAKWRRENEISISPSAHARSA